MNPSNRIAPCAPILCALTLLLAAQTGNWGVCGTADEVSSGAPASLFPRVSLTRGDRGSPMVALTFDDAPHPEIVPRLLALLRAEKAKATFFLVGDQLKNFTALAGKIVADEHEIGNHSLGHLNLRNRGRDEAEKEILGMQTLIKERLGIVPRIYRPAYGLVNANVKDVCEEAGLDIILWDVDTNDWRTGATSQSIVNEVLDNVSSGSIILCHATRQRTVDAVRVLIPVLRYRGFKFVTCSELLRERQRLEEMRRTSPGAGAPGAAEPSSSGAKEGAPKTGFDPLPPIEPPRLPGP